MRDKVFGKMRTLAPAKLEGRDKGDLVSLLTGDIELLEVFYAHTLSPAAIALVVSVVMVAFTATLSPLLALYAAFSYVVVGIAVPWISSKASGTGGREVRDAIGSMNAFVLDSLRGLRETLQFGRADDRAHELACRMSSLAKVEGLLKDRTAAAMAAKLKGEPLPDFPRETAIGALVLYISDTSIGAFQPMNVNFGIMSPLGYRVKGKANKNLAIAQRSLAIIDAMK